MKKALMVVLIAVATFAYGVAHAKCVAILENGTFVVTETKELLRVNDIPKGLDDADAVDRLITGELSEYKIEDKVGQTTDTLRFPWVLSKTVYSDEIVSYEDGNWTHNPLPVRTTPSYRSKFWTAFMVLIPLLGIVLASVVCPLNRVSLKKLLFLYIAIFISLATGAYFNPIAGFIVGYMVCIIASAVCTEAHNFFVSLLCGIAGAIIGVASNVLEGSIQSYALFLLGVEVNSFLLAWGVSEIRCVREELHKKSLRLERDVNRVRHKLLYSSYRN